MTEPAQHWGKLKSHKESAPVSESSDWEAEAFANCLNTPAGRQMMQILRSRTIERRARPQATEAELREMEAQRALVHDMEKERDRGIEVMDRRAGRIPK